MLGVNWKWYFFSKERYLQSKKLTKIALFSFDLTEKIWIFLTVWLWRNKQYNIFSTLCVCKDSSEIYWNHLLAKITWNQWFYYWITLQVFFTKLWNSAVWNGKKYHCLLKKIVKSNWSLEKSRLHVIFTTKLWKIVRGNHALHMGVKITEIYSHTILTKISWK